VYNRFAVFAESDFDAALLVDSFPSRVGAPFAPYFFAEVTCLIIFRDKD